MRAAILKVRSYDALTKCNSKDALKQCYYDVEVSMTILSIDYDLDYDVDYDVEVSNTIFRTHPVSTHENAFQT